jgi:hypothetical protein
VVRKGGEGFRRGPAQRAAKPAVAAEQGVGVEAVRNVSGLWPGEADQHAARLDIAACGVLLGGGERRVGEKDHARMRGNELRQRASGDAGGSWQRAA